MIYIQGRPNLSCMVSASFDRRNPILTKLVYGGLWFFMGAKSQYIYWCNPGYQSIFALSFTTCCPNLPQPGPPTFIHSWSILEMDDLMIIQTKNW